MQAPVPVPGDVVWIRQQRWRVERARLDDRVVRLDVANRGRRLTFFAPFDRPAPIDRSERLRRMRPQQAYARLAALAGRAYGCRTIATALDADIAILPHQLEPALCLIAGTRRILVADEVGLGKTIEAGLAIAEIQRRCDAARVLVVAPASLREQWIDELSGRFRIDCQRADRHGLDELARARAYGDDIWRRPGVWIASLDFIKQRHVIESLPFRPWDLVVIDEAHGAAGDSDRFDACHEIGRRARRLLLLTATPHSGDEARFARLCALGAFDGGRDPLTTFRRTRRELGVACDRRVHWHRVPLGDAERRLLDALGAYEAAVLQAAGASHRDAALLLLSVLRKRALSTASALLISIDRRLAWLGDAASSGDLDWLQPRLEFDDDDEIEAAERDSLTADIGLSGPRERAALRRLRALAAAAGRRESKLQRLAALVGRAREPVVVFTEFRHSLEAVHRCLGFGRTVATLHGGQTPSERREQLARFLEGSAGVLISTDVGGQGLNLQSRARWVVSLELPWNPARLEQRCGRVDRIGQRHRVHFTLLVARHEAEDGLLLRLARRTLVARRSLGDDLLATAVPTDRAIGAALFEGCALDESAATSATAPSCRKWTRVAIALARGLEVRRAWARRWRTPDAHSSRAGSTSLHRLPQLRRLSSGPVLVFSVPIVDGNGSALERHLVAVAVGNTGFMTRGVPSFGPADRLRQGYGGPPELYAKAEAGPYVGDETGRSHSRPMLPGSGVVEAARAAAARHIDARARRAGRLVRASGISAGEIDDSIVRHLIAIRQPGEAQPGLFDRREARAIDLALDDLDDITQDAARLAEERRRQSDVHVGRPVLELLLAGGR